MEKEINVSSSSGYERTMTDLQKQKVNFCGNYRRNKERQM
jgi:hypothetical protein